MTEDYEAIVELCSQDTREFIVAAARNDFPLKIFVEIFPNKVFTNLWAPWIEKKTFVEALTFITNSIIRIFSSDLIVRKTNQTIQKGRDKEIIMYVTTLIVSEIISYKINDNPLEMIERVKHLQKSWGLRQNYCAGLMVLFEASMKNSNKTKQWEKALNELLLLFNKLESNVDYYPFAKKTLNQAVGPTMWMLKKIRRFQALDGLYKKLLSTQRDTVISLLNKLNCSDRVTTFGKLLSDLCEQQNNKNYHQKAKNILILFLIYDNWVRLKQNCELKSKIVVLIMSECFGRLMYLLYDCDVKIAKLFLSFLSYSSLQSHQIRNKIVYHLIALYKIKRNSKSNLCQLIENIWNKKFMDFRVEEFYISKPPQFIKKSQKITHVSTQDCQTISSFVPLSDPFLKKKSQNSMSKASKMKFRKKIHWLKVIKQQIKLINIEKLYLLLEGFCLFYTNQYIEAALIAEKQSDVLGVVIMILQQLPPKLHYRFNPQLLYDSIKREISTLISKSETSTKLEQYGAENLGIFQLCYQDNRLDLESLIKLHLTYNCQQSLSTLLCISMIQEMIHSESKNVKTNKVKQLLQEKSFQLKLYLLFQSDFQNDTKILTIIGRLLSLKCQSITSNLLVNYAFNLFSREIKDAFVLTPKIKDFSILINPQIHSYAPQQRVKVILNMYTIFDNFQINNQSKSSLNSRKYMFFLRNQFHNSFFYNYYQVYKKYNYIIQAIHFLELHYYRNGNSKPNDYTKLSLLQLYSRINTSVAEVKQHIVSDLRLDSYKDQSTFVDEEFEKALMDIKFQAKRQLKIKNQRQLYEQEQFSRNRTLPNEKVNTFLDLISELKVSQEIVQKINTFKLLNAYRELHLKYNFGTQYHKNDVENLLLFLQKIKNEKNQIYFCRFVLSQLQLGAYLDKFQELYLQLLLKSRKIKELNKYIDQKIQSRKSQIPSKYHRLMILQCYQSKELFKALALLRTYQEDHGRLSVQLYRIQLECKYKVMFNFRVQNFFQLFQNCICDLSNDRNIKDNFEYYFKIFRMLYERYNFNRKQHNDIFLRIYKNFLQKNKVMAKNISYLSDCVLYLLRFVLQRFYNYEGMSQLVIKNIFSLVQNNYSCFAPFCDFLLSKLSTFPQKNAIIESLLVNILGSMPNESIWTYCFLKNFDYRKDLRPSSTNKSQNNEGILIDKIYKKVQYLEKQNLNLQYLNFVCELTQKCSRNSKQKTLVSQLKTLKVPKNLSYPFDNNFVIQRINYVMMSKNGKSAPVFITFQIKNRHTNTLKDAKVIIKYNASLGQNYRIQSNVANFFSQTGLLDQEITYKIVQLTKRLSMLEYVHNCGTVASLIADVISQYDSVQLYTDEITYSLYKKHTTTSGKETRSLQVYDQFAPKIKVQSFQFLISYNRTIKNFRDWWTVYTNFIRTFAQWSYLGYVVGLGDRHNQNILITQKGKLIHIDFQYVLDVGLTLRRPQWVPFRLTNFYTQCLGVLGTRGMAFAEMVAVAKKFKESEANIWKALSVFEGLFETNLTLEIMNRSKFQAFNFKSTQSAILWLIDNANNPDLLRQMFTGWNPQV